MEQLMRAVDTPADQELSRRNVRRIPMDRRRAGGDKINYLRVESVPLNKSVLRQNRILTGHETAADREPYQLLRTQVLHRLKENQWNALAVTSPCSGAGKTLTAINLAISMAKEVAYTVVLVDATLRHPAVLQHLGLAERPGLSEYLTDLIPIEELLVRPYYLEDLVVLPGGRPVENSAEMLSSPKMERLVLDLKASADKCVIIFDLPPVLATAETLAFSPQVDAALLVIEDGVTKKQDIARTMDLLSATNIIGTVLNKAGPAMRRA
jgi:capsular exopolysaccharide synthesis family protein